MEWISIGKKMPEDVMPDEMIIECLVHTNFGHNITHRVHDVQTVPVEVGHNTLEARKVDKGYYWEIEVGNSIREHPIYVQHWTLIDQNYDC